VFFFTRKKRGYGGRLKSDFIVGGETATAKGVRNFPKKSRSCNYLPVKGGEMQERL